MKISRDKNDILIYDADCFNLTHTFDCGQCFRWNQISDGEYIGTAFGQVLKIKDENGVFRLCGISEDDFYKIWNKYFDYDIDYKC